MKIFVSICSYRDSLLQSTLQSLIDTKSHRNEATYCIFEQTAFEESLANLYPELIERSDVIYKRIDPEYSEGVGWARYLNQLYVTDEDFFYQIDSHMLFEPNWDRTLVEDYKRARDIAGTEKVIIAGGTYSYHLIDGEIKKDDRFEPFTIKTGYYTIQNRLPGVHGDLIKATDMPEPAIHLFAGTLFTHAEWVKNVGNDYEMFNDGEEIMLTMRSFEAGYKLYHGTSIVTYHFFGAHEWPTKQWFKPVSNNEDISRRILKSVTKWYNYLDTVREDTLIDFYKYSGVDWINLTFEDRARCTQIKADENAE